ncbi:hypothetical protein BBQ_4921 [Burkholderia pseudomallei MSHR511]|nr:hypothetical protein BBS_4877 [Burkholderia pseudomallei NAU20B-16]AHG37249.1 hypothetical protein BBQ_4921 [Burkholderia pseudomallei MSHR511]AHG71200.1 hypothetical protein BBN_4675 [Burkholderia pseudomallei MSHR146]
MAADRTGFAPRADDARRGSEALIWCDAALCACDKAAHGRCGAGAGRAAPRVPGGVHPEGAHRFAHRSALRSRRRPSTLVPRRAPRPASDASRACASACGARDARACGACRARADAHNSPVSAAPRTAGGPAGGPISRSADRLSARRGRRTRDARHARVAHARRAGTPARDGARRPPSLRVAQRAPHAGPDIARCAASSATAPVPHRKTAFGPSADGRPLWTTVSRAFGRLVGRVRRAPFFFGGAHSPRMRRTHAMGTRR